MPQFETNSFPSQLFWLVTSFSILYVFISFVVLPRIRSNIRLRTNKISNDLERAESIRNQTEKMILEYNEKIEIAKEKSNTLLKNAIKKANDDLNNHILEMKETIEKKITKSEKELSFYKENIEKELNTSAKKISEVILSKVLNNDLSSDYLNNFLKKNMDKRGN